MPTFWSKLVLRGRNYGMQDDDGKVSTAKKKKKAKKGLNKLQLNSSSDTNFYENDNSDEYIYSTRDTSRMNTETIDYEDIAGMLMDNKPAMSDFHNNNSLPGGMAHYMPKTTQHLFLSGLLEGEKIDDYFQDCRLDNALKNFARFESYEHPEMAIPDCQTGKENVYETIEPDSPPSPQPVTAEKKRNNNNKDSHKLDILNWPTAPMTTSSPKMTTKQPKTGRRMTSTVDSAGEELDEDDNYVDFHDEASHSLGRNNMLNCSANDDSFDDTPWCSGVDVLY